MDLEEEQRLTRDSSYLPTEVYPDKDTAILVQSEVHHQACAAGEEISLDLSGSPTAFQHGFHYRLPVEPLDSPSECTTLSTVSTATTIAPPLDQKHRYHLFVACHRKDRPWAASVVERLESDAHNFRCCLGDRDFATDDDGAALVQNILCSAMLSHHVLVVLSPLFVRETWPTYEEGLSHLVALTGRKQRVIPVMLEECEVPDALRMLQMVDVRHGDFWDSLFLAISLDGIPCSDSLHTIRSLTSNSSGYNNGQLLTKLTSTVEGMCRSRLLFDYEEVPDSLISQDISFSRQEYAEIVKAVGREDHGARLSWLFTALPTILLAIIFVLWCVAFILVIILFPDNSPGTLPVRLSVFSLPAVFIVLGCGLRWRKLKQYKERFSICMFSRSVQVNKLLYDRNKPVILTTARTNEDTFQIFFIYFNLNDCVERIKIFLTHCTNEDIVKLSKLIEVYTLHSTYLDAEPIAARLAVMMSAAYGIQLLFKRIPHALEQRHTRRRQCLCQFVEEFLAAYLPCIRQEAEVGNLRFIFLRYLNCQFRPDPVILHTLGIQLMQC